MTLKIVIYYPYVNADHACKLKITGVEGDR